ncbi:hypothetical protein THIX_60931 [Thiomonas sp. X19]|nr:hypothetical protein THIX_60931 [Thiomonas sp. X19]
MEQVGKVTTLRERLRETLRAHVKYSKPEAKRIGSRNA